MGEFTGKVAWFNGAKGYGFLTRSDAEDVFCHFTAIQKDGYRSLSEGEPVEFDVVQGDHGQQAANVVSLKRRVNAEKKDLNA